MILAKCEVDLRRFISLNCSDLLLQCTLNRFGLSCCTDSWIGKIEPLPSPRHPDVSILVVKTCNDPVSVIFRYFYLFLLCEEWISFKTRSTLRHKLPLMPEFSISLCRVERILPSRYF